MKLLLVSINSKYIHSSLAPWYLLSAVKDLRNIEAEVAEGTINEKTEIIVQRLLSKKPKIIGFSCYIWNIRRIEEIIASIDRVNPAIKIFLGGPEVSYRAEDILRRNKKVFAVISGEGEYPLQQMCTVLSENSELKNIPGVCYRCDDKIIITKPYVSKCLPPDPYCEEYFRALNGRIAYFEASRACPFSCAFCLSGNCGKLNVFPLEESRRRLLKLASSGTKTIKFVDRTFNADKALTDDWLRFLIEHRGVDIPENVCFHFEIGGDILDKETILLMSKLPRGMVQLEIGLQSFNEKSLEAVMRKTNMQKLEENIKQLISFNNMHIHIDLLIGLPYEGIESFKNSFNKAFELRPHMLQIGFLKLLYGSAMREDADKYPCNYRQEPPYEITSNPWLDETDIERLHDMEDAFERIYNSGRLRNTMDYVLSETKLTAFDFFMKIKPIAHFGVSLNEYEEGLYKALLKEKEIEAVKLRDMMVIDRISTDASGRLPHFLRIEDEKLRLSRKIMEKADKLRSKPGIKRGIAIIYSSNELIYADYENKDPVNGLYEIKHIPLEELFTLSCP